MGVRGPLWGFMGGGELSVDLLGFKGRPQREGKVL